MMTEKYNRKIELFHNNENDHLGFVYVPKTGGTYLSMSFIPKRYHGEKYKISRLASSFHMPASRVVDIVGPNTPLFTMIRDPYDRACSEYYFIRRKIDDPMNHLEWNCSDPTKIDFVAKRAKTFMGLDFYYEKVLAIYKNNFKIEDYLEWYHSNPTYPVYYDIKTPKDFDVVGMTENIPQTIMMLDKMYGIKIFQGSANNNPNKKVNHPYKTGYSRKSFKKQNYLEYSFYSEGKEKYHKLISKNKIL